WQILGRKKSLLSLYSCFRAKSEQKGSVASKRLLGPRPRTDTNRAEQDWGHARFSVGSRAWPGRLLSPARMALPVGHRRLLIHRHGRGGCCGRARAGLIVARPVGPLLARESAGTQPSDAVPGF